MTLQHLLIVSCQDSGWESCFAACLLKQAQAVLAVTVGDRSLSVPTYRHFEADFIPRGVHLVQLGQQRVLQ